MTFKISSTLKLTQRGKEYLPVSEHLCFKICIYFWELENCPHKACNRIFLLTGLWPTYQGENSGRYFTESVCTNIAEMTVGDGFGFFFFPVPQPQPDCVSALLSVPD